MLCTTSGWKMLNLRKWWELFFGHSLSLETDALFYAKKIKKRSHLAIQFHSGELYPLNPPPPLHPPGNGRG